MCWPRPANEALDGGAGGDDDEDALAQIGSGAVPGGQERRATGTGRFALRAVHHAVDQEGLFVSEELERRMGPASEVNPKSWGISPPGGRARLWAATCSSWRSG